MLRKMLGTTALLIALAAGLAVPAEARMRALLVGVADYNTPGINDLLGPRNDVTLIWRALKARNAAPTDITVLADGLPAGPDFPVANALPQRAEILAALDRLASTAQPGDMVMFYYSGHGSVQPVNPDVPQDEPEADGNDQILLPADVGPYDIITRSVRNAIVDNELSVRFDAIRARGAFVWAVVDACHSGTVTRGESVVRTVDPSVLGVPPAEAAQATRSAGPQAAVAPSAGAGGIAGFYAVESYAEAIERPFTGYDPKMVGEGDRQRMGVFTYHLHRALLRNSAASLRDLAQEIVADMASDRSGGKVPPPVFDGALDQPVFGAAGARRHGAVTGTLADGRLTLPAGTLHGFAVGARIDLHLPGKEATVAQAEITEATPVSSVATGIVWTAPAAKAESGSLAAVVTAPAANFRFVVSPPPAEDGDAGRTLVDAAIGSLFAESSGALGISRGEPGDPDADLILRIRNGRLWILRPDRPWVETPGAFDETPSFPLTGGAEVLAMSLEESVFRLARAARLLRVASSLAEGSAVDEEEGLAVSAKIVRAAQGDPKQACPKQPPAAGAVDPLLPLLPVKAGNCDLIEIEVRNEGERDYYISGFYVDSLGGIAVIPQSSEKSGCVRTLPMGTDKPLRFAFRINTWDRANNRPSSTGPENFVLMAAPKDDNRQPPRLCALTQPTLARMQETRSAEAGSTRGVANQLQSLLEGLEGGTATRAASDEEGGGPVVTNRLYVFDVRP
jgi:hypothetical protein